MIFLNPVVIFSENVLIKFLSHSATSDTTLIYKVSFTTHQVLVLLVVDESHHKIFEVAECYDQDCI